MTVTSAVRRGRYTYRHFSTNATAKCLVASSRKSSSRELLPQDGGILGIFLLLCTAATTTNNTITHAEESPLKAAKNEKKLSVCGKWCANIPSSNQQHTKCQMDTNVIPCKGEWCTTTCELWNLFVLGSKDKHRPVSCELYKAGMAYPRGAQVCDASCLIPEVSPSRYPAPTGLGILCRPNTCSPGATPLKDILLAKEGNKGLPLGEMQCPCNWFGSECKNDWLPVKAVVKNEDNNLGGSPLEFVTLVLDKQDWDRVIRDYRPGGVVRIVHEDEDGIPREFACALASFDTPGELTFLTAPSDPALHFTVRQVADRIRNLSSSSEQELSNLYVNPSISGFFNGNYTYLMDYLISHEYEIQNMVILSSGTGLGGALSAVDAVIKENKDKNPSKRRIKIHLYYGLRNVAHLPYRERLEALAAAGDIELTLVVSNSMGLSSSEGSLDERLTKNWLSDEIQEAVKRGEASGKLEQVPTDKLKPFLSSQGGSSRPYYTQHLVGLDFASDHGPLRKNGVCLENTVFVSCGRIEILDDMTAILRALSEGNDELVSEHVFTNI